MEITKTSSGEILHVAIRGRLDGYWADDLSRVLQECIREGAHHIRLDVAGVDYISSIGLGALLEIHQRLAAIHGSFFVVNPSKNARKILELSGMHKILMSEEELTLPPPVPVSKAGRIMERENCSIEVFELSRKASLHCSPMGNPELLQQSGFKQEHCLNITLPESSIAIGLGALGDEYADCQTRFGEFLAIAGTVAYQPTDGSGVPDHMVITGTFVPSIQVLYGLVCDGGFSNVFHFHQKKDSKPVTLSDLAEIGLQITGANSIGMTIVAESAGLLGAWLRRSPAIESGVTPTFTYPGVREWLSFAAERTFHRSMVVAAGVVLKSSQQNLLPFVRPLWRNPYPSGHFHAASFTYSPLKKGETDLKKVVKTLTDHEVLQGVLHLLCDDREAEGTGQSEFVRGACWISPLADPAAQGNP